ncbi:hypothetical protein B0H17DRAFT_1123595 [Mycena rosella]|uniref:Enoyl reductase (ER) domain-containing protein n=1 Tax=Mycena rosella TaxID=1033263 RepID=A0AAD7MCD7_MYCRO|nr:hypothetical protein B0H17DRAFT_1123595 [Mycena rosella]
METIELDSHLLNGGFLVKTLVLSVDPYMRGRMKDSDAKSFGAFALGKPWTEATSITGFGVGVVLRSENRDVPTGKHLYGMGFPHQEYFVLPDISGFIFLERHSGLPWSVYVGAAGMPGAASLFLTTAAFLMAGTGKTAYAGWKEYAHAKQGETAFVTAGAGPVGSMVIQLAKRDGLKVIASAGSDNKVKFMRDIGADVAFNYKTTDTREILAREGPIDVYWDNVGGDVLDAALEYAAIYARFLNLDQVYAKSLTISGVAAMRLAKYDEEFYATVPRALVSGSVGDALLAVQKGANKGKAVVVVAEE